MLDYGGIKLKRVTVPRFIIICMFCRENSKVNIHFDDSRVRFQCLECGRESIVSSPNTPQTTKKDWEETQENEFK